MDEIIRIEIVVIFLFARGDDIVRGADDTGKVAYLFLVVGHGAKRFYRSHRINIPPDKEPIVSIATSNAWLERPLTKLWWNSSLNPYNNPKTAHTQMIFSSPAEGFSKRSALAKDNPSNAYMRKW